MLPKPPTTTEIVHMVHLLKMVGETGYKLLEELYGEWRRHDEEQRARLLTQPLAPPAPSVPLSSDGLLKYLRSSGAGMDWPPAALRPSEAVDWASRCHAMLPDGTRCPNTSEGRVNVLGQAYCLDHRVDGQCHGITKAGKRCTRLTSNVYCFAHQPVSWSATPAKSMPSVLKTATVRPDGSGHWIVDGGNPGQRASNKDFAVVLAEFDLRLGGGGELIIVGADGKPDERRHVGSWGDGGQR
jgi:hypothetical protein